MNRPPFNLHLFSDPHLDMWGMEPPICKADACAVLGDIHEGTHGYDFVRRIADTKPVLLVLGNHEFYLSSLKDTYAAWEEKAKSHGNIFLLQNSTHVINDVRFIGATLWTDFNNQNPLCLIQGMGVTKDYMYIDNDERDERINSQFILSEHLKSKSYFQSELEKEFEGKTVLLSHHSLTHKSVPEIYQGHPHNYMYCSELDSMLLYNKVDFYAHGHMHSKTDCMIGDTRVVANPRGTNKYPNKEFDPFLVVKI